MKCQFCNKECSMLVFIPETHMTIDFPICNDICLKKLRIERGYDNPKELWEIDFKIMLLQTERKDYVNRINKEIELLEKLKEAKE
jgi:hypothetical protein